MAELHKFFCKESPYIFSYKYSPVQKDNLPLLVKEIRKRVLYFSKTLKKGTAQPNLFMYINSIFTTHRGENALLSFSIHFVWYFSFSAKSAQSQKKIRPVSRNHFAKHSPLLLNRLVLSFSPTPLMVACPLRKNVHAPRTHTNTQRADVIPKEMRPKKKSSKEKFKKVVARDAAKKVFPAKARARPRLSVRRKICNRWRSIVRLLFIFNQICMLLWMIVYKYKYSFQVDQ